MLRLAVALAGLCLVLSVDWTNWAGNQHYTPVAILNATTEADVIAVVNQYNFTRVKLVGSSHSFSQLCATEAYGYMLQLQPPSDPVTLLGSDLVRTHAGLRLNDLNAILESRYGLAMSNLGAISMQQIGGATATNTHGTGNTGGLSSFIRGMRIVLPNGTAVTANSTSHSDLFSAARAGWGVLGIVISLDIHVVPIWRMEQILAPFSVSDLIAGVPVWMAQFERLQFYWTPYTESSGYLLIRQNTTGPITGCWGSPRYSTPLTPPPSGLGAWPVGTTACTDVSYKTLTASGDDAQKYTEMEMMVDVAHTFPLISAFRELQDSVKPQWNASVELFTGVRFVKGDDIPLSPFYNRDSTVLSMIVFGTPTAPAPADQVYLYHSALQKIAYTNFSGRIHPGKNNYLTRDLAEQMWPDTYATFNNLRASIDLHDMFFNGFLQLVFGGC